MPVEPSEPDASRDLILPGGRSVPYALLNFSTSRSSGPGGQNVNKVNSKVTLTVSLDDLATCLPEDAMRRLPALAGQRCAADRLVISASDSRSQVANRRACMSRLRDLLVLACHRPRVRRATRPSKGAVQRRLDAKKQRGQAKQRRARPTDHD